MKEELKKEEEKVKEEPKDEDMEGDELLHAPEWKRKPLSTPEECDVYLNRMYDPPDFVGDM